MQNYKPDTFYQKQLKNIFPQTTPGWLNMDFVNRDMTHNMAINMKENKSINFIIKCDKKIKEDLIFNTYYQNYSNGILQDPEEAVYLDFEKELNIYTKANKYLSNLSHEMDKEKEDRSVRWIVLDKKYKRFRNLLEKKFLIVDNIQNIDNEYKEKVLIKNILEYRFENGYLTMVFCNQSYREIRKQLKKEENKSILNFAYNSWFDILDLNKIINYQKEFSSDE